MLAIIKTICILLLEIVIFYILGTVLVRLVMRQRKVRISERVIIGFLVLQVMFQVCALPFIYFDTTLTLLTKVWRVVMGVVLLVSAVIIRKGLLQDIKEVIEYLKAKKWVAVILFMTILAVCYYVSINGEQNDDAIYYIGLINTTLSMDSMYRFNVYNGYGMESLYLRRALTTFDIHSAALCKIFDVHPLILARIGRASLNVILTAVATYLIGLKLFGKDNVEKAEKKACMLVMVSFAMNFLFAGNIYTSATFLLTRAYEGKAFGANILVLFTLYTCIKHITERQKADYVALVLILWGSLAVSSSALVVNAMAIAILLIPYYGMQIMGRIQVK